MPKKAVGVGLRAEGNGTWVQVDRKAMELWGQLALSNPGAAQLLGAMISKMGPYNALVVSQKVLADLAGCSLPTVKRRLKALRDGNWIEARQIGPTGTANAYIINDRVAWSGKRDGIRYSMFSAAVIVSDEEQPDAASLDNQAPLNRFPNVYSGEMQLPSGDGLEPPSEPAIPGLELDLPSRSTEPQQTDLEDFTGRPNRINKLTGEIIED